MTDSRAVADDRREIDRELERRIADLANRVCTGSVALQRFRLWLLARGLYDQKRLLDDPGWLLDELGSVGTARGEKEKEGEK